MINLVMEDVFKSTIDLYAAVSANAEVLRVTVGDGAGAGSVYLTLKQAEQLKQFLNDNF